MSILPLMLLAMMTLASGGGGGDTLLDGAVAADTRANADASAAPTTPVSPTPVPSPTTRPIDELSTRMALVVGVFLVTFALVGAAVAGVFRRDSICGPPRLAPGEPVMPILLVLVIGAGCWFGGQMLFVAIRAQQHARTHGGERMTLEHLDSWDLALLATVPALVALLVMLAADAPFGLLRPIGLRLARLPRSVLGGIGGGVIALPLVYGLSYPLEVFYKSIDFQHPSEHELLGAMKDASPAAQMVLVLGACVMAPAFEELLFRGHMQTLLTRVFLGAGARRMPPPPLLQQQQALGGYEGIPMSGNMAAEAATPLVTPMMGSPAGIAYASPGATPADSSAMRWLAVIITSAVFALIHPLWTAPLIFLLSLALGYAYERTGSLWVPIVMHAMFNTSSTLLFLQLM